MIRISVYGGARSIGGNKILLEDGDARVFFDFGMSFKVRERYYEEYLKPRPGTGLLDLLEMELGEKGHYYGSLLPRLEGLYRRDLEPAGDVWARFRDRAYYRRLEDVAGVLVSHAHIDHTGYISFLRPEIPIYSSAMTAFIAKAMQVSGIAEFEKEVCYLTPREQDDEEGPIRSTKDWRKVPHIQRPFALVDGQGLSEKARAFWNEKPGRGRGLKVAEAVPDPSRIGGLRARAFPLDHSVYGACAWAVETSVGWVVYTGDLRVHGSRSEMTRRFIEEARGLRPRVLLCEGTRVGEMEARGHERTDATEDEVAENLLAEVRGVEGLVVADFGPRNVERLETFLRVARECGRRLVILAKDAYMLDAMRLVSGEVASVASEEDMLIYKDLKVEPMEWERRLRGDVDGVPGYRDRFVTGRQVAAAQGEYILCFSFWDVKNLIDIEPKRGKYIYSSSEVYSEDQGIDIGRLRNWLAHFGLEHRGLPFQKDDGSWGTEDEGLHASGHAASSDIMELVREIRPQTVLPIHTEHPERFVEEFRGEEIEVIVSEYGEAVELS
ncbi:MAG: MBL fold metallo-hydrolase RNA specificity domain-containing protein [Dehalococcoidia bacterium]